MSAETGAYLYIGAQHTGAQGDLVHYTSPRLRIEGKGRALKLSQLMIQTVTNCLRARRETNHDLVNQLDDASRLAEEQSAIAESAQAACAMAQAEAMTQRQAAQAMEAELKFLRARVVST